MKIAILNFSAPYAPLDHYGSAAEVIERWLSPQLEEAKFTELDIAAGTSFPTPEHYNGFIISGSEKGVYDNCDWMEPLRNYLRTLRDRQIPVFGICFGHQVMAEAYGGKAVKAEHNFVVGAKLYTEGGNTYFAHAMHQDQVIEIPPAATITASADYCPVAALTYDFPACSVQFHPEFDRPLVADAIEAFEGDLLTSSEAVAARRSIADDTVEQTLYAAEIAEFFRSNSATAP